MHSRHMQKRRSRLQCWRPAHLLFQSRHSQSLRSGRCSPQPLTASGGSASPCPQGQSLIGKSALMKIADDQCQTEIGSDVLHVRDRGGPHLARSVVEHHKPILAAAVLKLAEAEKLNLDQLYADWLASSTHPGSDQLWVIRCVGRAIGHSGVGHDTVSSVYAFPDLPGRPIAAAFACGTDEGISKREVVRRALNL